MASQIKERFHPNSVIKRIKPESASMRKKENKIKINPADPNNSSFFKGNLRNIVANLKELFKRNPLKPMYTQSL